MNNELVIKRQKTKYVLDKTLKYQIRRIGLAAVMAFSVISIINVLHSGPHVKVHNEIKKQSKVYEVKKIVKPNIRFSFIKEMSKIQPAPKVYYDMIYKDAKQNHVIPKYSAAIAITESHMNPEATSPSTIFGYSRGMYQILDSTAKQLGVQAPYYQSYDPSLNISKGNKYLSILANDLSGTLGSGIYHNWFSIKKIGTIKEVLYLGQPIQDQYGHIISLETLVALAYNGGLRQVTDAIINSAGILNMNPLSSNCSFSAQQMDYILKVNQIYSLHYQFHYDF